MEARKQAKITTYGRHHRRKLGRPKGSSGGRGRAARDASPSSHASSAAPPETSKKCSTKARGRSHATRTNWASPDNAARLACAVKEWDAPAGAANSAAAAAPTMAAFAKTKATP